ncbi:MAG: biotin carboxylase N-terminal domain-containing protein [Myxococcota bacterium]|nr:biotin carboxylase N-terminal domain-containing protein [Myxococcota bacterium]
MQLERILIAERGPLAGMLHRSLLASGYETVAVFGEKDQLAPHVEEASYAAYVPGLDREGDLIGACLDAGCDALHPGAGPLAENEKLAADCRDAGLAFIGPRPEQIEGLSNRWTTRELCVASAVPVVPGSPLLLNHQQVREQAKALGLPLWLKNPWGLEPMRFTELEPLVEEATARIHAGQRVWLERHVPDARHVTVTVVADQSGEVVPLGVQERSSRHQGRLSIEQAPAPVSAALSAALEDAAVAVAKAVRFVGVGSVGFLVDPSGAAPCIGLRPRLSMSSLLTDVRHGLRLAEVQVRVVTGGPIGWTREELAPQEVALSIRIRARSRGTLEALDFPADVQVETALAPQMDVGEGAVLAVLVIRHTSRPSCVVRAIAALKEARVVGVETDIAECVELLGDPTFWSGGVVAGES